MSKIVILQRDIPVWTNASWADAHRMIPRLEKFCFDRFGIFWDFWDLTEEEIYTPEFGQLPHAIVFERDIDATIFVLSFK